jgi:hypothetical protein
MAQKVYVAPDQPSNLRGLLSGIGMIGGAIAAPFTGGASVGLGATLAGIGAGAGLGSAAGQLTGGVGDAVANKDKDFQGGGVPLPEESAVSRRLDKKSDNFQHIMDALNVVNSLPEGAKAQAEKDLTLAASKAYGQKRFGVA